MSRLIGRRPIEGKDYNVKKHKEQSWENAIQNSINKLGKLEDIEDELGCPLDVVFRAIDEGVCASVQILDLETTDTIERPRLYYSDDFKCYCFELLFGEGVVKLKDYKKTWWLKGEKQNAN